MDEVHEILTAIGGVNALSSATGFPQQTVSEWGVRTPPDIPPWRRPAVLDAVNRLKVEVSPRALAYLASNQRRPRRIATPTNTDTARVA